MITLPDYIESILLIADPSDSAASSWKEISQAIAGLITVLPPTVIENIYFLGQYKTIPADLFEAYARTVRPGGISLAAPVIETLKRNRQRAQAAILIGSGQVFDLQDHLNSARVDHWAAVRTGSESLLPKGVNIPEFSCSDLSLVISWLQNLTFRPSTTTRTHGAGWSTISQQWALDRAGYPLLLVEPLQAWMHLLPVSKPHFEAYLSTQSQLGDAWYQTLLQLNPRRSYQAADLSAYEELLLTGILPEEALAFASWLGPEYCLPGIAEWREGYRWLGTQPAELPVSELDRAGLAESARALWFGLHQKLSPTTLLELSLMSQGVIEWLGEPAGSGLGKTRPSFRPKLTDPLNDDPTRPIPQDARRRYFGFRLFRKEL